MESSNLLSLESDIFSKSFNGPHISHFMSLMSDAPQGISGSNSICAMFASSKIIRISGWYRVPIMIMPPEFCGSGPPPHCTITLDPRQLCTALSDKVNTSPGFAVILISFSAPEKFIAWPGVISSTISVTDSW